jgi:Zn-finger nucleic acid-binding protein
MERHTFDSQGGTPLELDLCFRCQGLWFDRHENLKLTPQAVVALFQLLHEHRTDERQPVATRLQCPRCPGVLDKGFDIVRHGRYVTYRCGARHGRFSAFSSFMVEKGFVRQLTRPEIDELAARIQAITCSSCGAPVDIRQDHACPYCRAPFSLIDPQAVVKAMEGYARASTAAAEAAPPGARLGDAVIAMERERLRAERERRAQGETLLAPALTDSPAVDLLAVGVALVWGALKG